MSKLKQRLSYLGPGFIVAATGVGAGDLIAASVAGARYGTVILWAALLGGVLKFTVLTVRHALLLTIHPLITWVPVRRSQHGVATRFGP
jgi:Mn2+/Fe2+ NRAMP family transporter